MATFADLSPERLDHRQHPGGVPVPGEAFHREPPRCAREPRAQVGPLSKLLDVRDHLPHVAGRMEERRLPMGEDLGDLADGARHYRHAPAMYSYTLSGEK